ncbi:MAG: Gfo/Idh/MocA family oxidoreductase [Candidatus Bathyarchaeia archaeon]|jgi:predicted dehydrogenase
MGKVTKVGLIGCGDVAEKSHMRVYEYLGNPKVVAVADISIERAKSLANRHNVDRVYSNYLDLLGMDDLDFVDICTPTSTHCRIVSDAAKAGRNVFVEKPMARTSGECERMISECERAGIKLCVCHNQKFYASVLRAKSMLHSEKSTILSVRTTAKWTNPSIQPWTFTPEEGGLLWEVLYHPSYLTLDFLPDVREVYAVGNKVEHQVYDNCMIVLRTGADSYGSMEFSLTSKVREKSCEVTTRAGNRLRIDLEYDYLTTKSTPDPPVSIRSIAGRFLLDEKEVIAKPASYGMQLARRRKEPGFFTHLSAIRGYISSLESDSAVPIEPEEGRRTVRFIECVEKSLNEARAVSL